MMDRPVQKKQSNVKLYATIGAAIGLLVLAAWVLMSSASMRIGKDKLQLAVVAEGPFNAYVVGNGTVVPKHVDYIMPKTSGELVDVNVESGDAVKKGQVLFVIQDEELLLEYGNREIALAEAQAALAAKAFELETQKLQLRVAVLQAQSAFKVQVEEFEANRTLIEMDNPPISLLKYRQSKIQAEQLKDVYELEQTRLANFEDSKQSQLNQFELKVSLAQNMLNRIGKRVDDLNLRSKLDGIIQDVDLKPGQRVEVGTVIGLVTNPEDVYVRLKVSAVQGHRLRLGQTAIVTTRGEDRSGRVIRIDPNVKGTTIDVDIELDDDAKLRTNMFVSGKVIIQELANALFVEAPSNTIENGVSSFYQFSADGSHIELIKVETGLISAGVVQILSGLQHGDQIVTSDTGSFNGAERVNLH